MKLKLGVRLSEVGVVLALLSVFFILCVSSIALKTKTYDEKSHYHYGRQMLELNSDRFDDSKMPFSVINVVVQSGIMGILKTLKILEILPSNARFKEHLRLQAARVGTILFALILAFFVYRWSRELYGVPAGIFSLFLVVFSPNIIAHARLVTTDIYASGMLTISTFYFWKFLKYHGWRNAGMSAVTLGLAQLAKYTSVFLYLIYLVIVLARYWKLVVDAVLNNKMIRLLKWGLVCCGYLVFFLSVSILVINTGFLFNKSFIPIGNYHFKSSLMKHAQAVPVVDKIPVPVPYPYLQGLDWIKYRDDSGKGYGNIYLFGKLRSRGDKFDGFKGYYLFASLFKVPIATQIILILALANYLRRWKSYAFREDEQFLLIPVIFFTVYFNLFINAQIGLRHFLVVFPLMAVFCGSFFRDWKGFEKKRKVAIGVLMTWLIVSVMSYYPHFLSYFNELVWNRTRSYKLLADSNIDWGQNGWYLKRWAKRNKDAQVHPQEPAVGKIVVSVNNLVGVFSPERYAWLRDNFEPFDHIAYSFLVYDVQENHLREALKESEP
jgi:4-amino-4-deoxy-L-arabinose transferase-like glycosyltransferase